MITPQQHAVALSRLSNTPIVAARNTRGQGGPWPATTVCGRVRAGSAAWAEQPERRPSLLDNARRRRTATDIDAPGARRDEDGIGLGGPQWPEPRRDRARSVDPAL